MRLFIVGVLVGLIIATVGLGGVGRIIDNGVSKVQTISKEAAQ